MQKNWPKQEINMNILLQYIIQFFETQKFDITVLKSETSYEVVAGNSPCYKIESDILVTIDENPNDFSINLELSKEKRREDFRFPVILTTVFGGGYFLLKHLKSDEAWMKFKNDFWRQMDSIISV